MKRIVFIDDDPLELDLLKQMLEDQKEWETKFFMDSKEGVKYIKEKDADLVFCDVNMPGTSGLDLIKELKGDEKTRDVPVVTLTGNQDITLKRQALDAGAIDLMSTPVQQEDLIARINSLIKIQEYQDIIKEKNKLLEKQLVISQKIELVGVMASGAIHDLNNLLSIIIGYSAYLKDQDVFKDKGKSKVIKIEKAGVIASRLINHILKFSKYDDTLNVFDAPEIMKSIISTIKPLVPKEIELEYQDPLKEFYLEMNVVQFQQVMMNILLNSIQAMPNGGNLFVGIEPEGDDRFCVFIKDTGSGMDTATQNKIFEPLFTTKTKDIGTGLGLFVVKHILDEINGTIEVQSELGKGTTFKMCFPCAEEP